MPELYWLFLFLVSLFIAYTQGFQRATLFWGKRLAANNEYLPTGLQDAITPMAQTIRNIAIPILLIGTGIFGAFLVGWYMAVLGPLATFVLAGFLLRVIPKPEYDFYKKKILRGLKKKEVNYGKNNDAARLLATEEVIAKFIVHNRHKSTRLD